MSEESLRSEIAALSAAIEEEKLRGRMFGQPFRVDDSPPLSMDSRREARRLIDDWAARRSQPPQQNLQPASVDWRMSEEVQRQAQAMQQIADQTRVQRLREDFVSAANRYTPDNALEAVRQNRQNTLDALQAQNQSRPPSNPSIQATGPDRTPITRTPRTMGHNYNPRATEPPRTGMPTGFAEPLPRQPVQLDTGPAPTLPAIPNTPTASTLPRPMSASPPLSGALAAGRSAMPMSIVGGALSFGMGVAAGVDPRRAALGGLGATAGTIAGAVLGSFFGPAGTIAGGSVGATIGGTVGAVLGQMAGNQLADWLGLPISTADPGQMPAAGNGAQVLPIAGQRSAYYLVTVEYTYYYDFREPFTGTSTQRLYGPIRGLTHPTNRDQIISGSAVYVFHGPADDVQRRVFAQTTGFSGFQEIALVGRFVSIVPEATERPETVPYTFPGLTNPTYSFPGRQPHPLNSPQTNYAPNSTPAPGGSTRPADSPFFVPSGYPNARNEPSPQTYNLGGPMPALLPQRPPDPRPDTEPEGSLFPGSYSLSLPLGAAFSPTLSEGRYNESYGEMLGRLSRESQTNPETQTTPNQQGNHTANPTPLQNLFPGQSALPGLLPVIGRAPQQPTNTRNTPTLDNAPGTGDRNAPQPTAQPSQPGGTGTGTGDIPSPTCRFRDDPYSAGIDQRTQEMKTIELAIQQYQTQMLAAIDAKLGPQIPNGGLSGLLQKVGNLTKKTWDFLQVDRILSVLTYVTALHNAYQLSANLSATLFDMFSGVLDAIGIENDDGSPLDVSGMVNKWTENFFKGLIGEENVEGMKSAWLKYSRIYQAAMNIIYTVSSMVDSLRSLTEIVGENVGKIGNALRRSGAVMENSFGWMQEKLDRLSVGNSRWEKLFSRVDQVDNVASSIGMAAGEVVSIQDNMDQLKTNREEAKTALADAGFGDSPESTPIAEKEQENKQDSESPVSLENPQIGAP